MQYKKKKKHFAVGIAWWTKSTWWNFSKTCVFCRGIWIKMQFSM